MRHGNEGGQCEINGILESDSMLREGKSVNISLSHLSIVFNVFSIYIYMFYICIESQICQDFGACIRSFYIVGLLMMLYTL